MVLPDRRRVDELRAAELRPGVHPHDDRGRNVARREDVVAQLRVRLGAERRPVAPHVELARVPLDHVDRRIAPLRVVVVARREVDPEGAFVRVAERVSPQRLALEDVLLEPSRERVAPGSAHAFGELHGLRSASVRCARTCASAIRSCASESRSRIVTVSSASVCSSIGEGERRADLVLPPVAPADRAAVVVLDLRVDAQLLEQRARLRDHVGVLADQRQHGSLDRCQRGVEAKHRSLVVPRRPLRRTRRSGT